MNEGMRPTQYHIILYNDHIDQYKNMAIILICHSSLIYIHEMFGPLGKTSQSYIMFQCVGCVATKSKPKSDKVFKQQTNSKQTNNKRQFFLPKINKVFLSPILQNLRGRSVLDNFFENDPLDNPNVLSFHKVGQKRKMVINIEFTLSHF